MEYSPKDTIKLHMDQKTNEELLDIWVKNKRNEYTDKTFFVIYDILQERGVDIPLQSKLIESIEPENYNITISGFLTFQFMISSMLIEIIYALGAIGITVSSFIVIMRKQFLIGFLCIIVGNLIWRLICETAIIFFRINEQLDQLGLIHEELKRK